MRYVVNFALKATCGGEDKIRTEPGKGGEIQLTDALKVLARQQDMYAYDFIGRRYDVGDKQSYLEAQVEYALRREDLRDRFREYLKVIMGKC